MAKKKLTWQAFDKASEEQKQLINDQIVKDSSKFMGVSFKGTAFTEFGKWQEVSLIRWERDKWIVTIIDYDVYAKWYIPDNYQIDDSLLK